MLISEHLKRAHIAKFPTPTLGYGDPVEFWCCGAVGKIIFISSFALEGLNQTVKRKDRYGEYRAQHDGQCVNTMLKM